MFKRVLLSAIALACFSNAQAFDFKGTTSVQFPTNSRVHALHNGAADSAATASNGFKTVVLMKANLSAKEKQAFTGFNPELDGKADKSTSGLPAAVDVGMNNVPVLNQGKHGSCVTFATTAAVDALLGKGDYVSQLCSLELGSYLEKRSDLPSGWEGSMGPVVLNHLAGYGVVSTSKQKEGVCSSVTDYPAQDQQSTGKEMSLDDYHAVREPLANFYWEPVLGATQRILNTYDHGYHAEEVLQAVKKTLAEKPLERQVRVTFGVLLPVAHCFAGACAKYHQANDTWALTESIDYDVVNPALGGHEMVITGYDDNATVIDNEGKTHTGIFKLRNSWGADVGDNGDFYMTYDFFKKFVFEVQKVYMLEDENK